MHTLKLIGITIPACLAIDLFWLGVVMTPFYSRELGDLARRDPTSGGLAPRWGAAALVYLLIPLGVVLFVGPKFGPGSTPWSSLGWGALFGLVLYGVYDLTNRAVLDKWTLRVTIGDMLWGCTLCGVTALIGHFADKWLRGPLANS